MRLANRHLEDGAEHLAADPAPRKLFGKAVEVIDRDGQRLHPADALDR